MKLHGYPNREAAAAAFEALGLEAAADAVRGGDVDRLYRSLPGGIPGGGDRPLDGRRSRRHRRARHLAGKLEGAERDLVGLRDPAAAMLRHLGAPRVACPVSGEALDEEAVRYASPDALQSSQSPAAYLKYLYDLARERIEAVDEAFDLERRRPDLEHLVLSEDHLSREITTLALANELLVAQLLAHDVAEDEAALFEALKTTRHPFSMPFDADNATVREALAAMSGASLGAVALRGRQDGYALDREDFTLVADPADRLRLYGDHVALLAERPDAQTLYGAWFGLADPGGGNAALQFADAFTAASGLSFQEYQALLGDDAAVVDEAGEVYANLSNRFTAKGWHVVLGEEEDGRYRTRGHTAADPTERDLPWHVHEMQNKCIRLQRRTGLAFHELNWLLLAAVYGHPSYEDGDEVDGGESAIQDVVLGDGTGLDVLAHYVEWAQRHELGVERFAALVGDIDCYHRAGGGATSLMRTLFGADAPEITRRTRRHLPVDPVPVGEVDGDGEAGHLGAILRRGFKLSRIEWDVVVAQVSEAPAEVLDSAMMGRMYRLSHLFGLMGWSVLEGIELLAKAAPAVLATLSRSDVCTDVLRALDKVSWLSDWMEDAAFPPGDVMTVLTAPEDAALHPNQDILNWVVELQRGVEGALVAAPDFAAYVMDWDAADGGDPVDVPESRWLEGLTERNLLDARGLVAADSREGMHDGVVAVLVAAGADAGTPASRERAGELADRLWGRRDEQAKRLTNHAVQQGEGLAETAVAPLLRWMGTDAYGMLAAFLAWDASGDPAHADGLQRLFDLHRHMLVAGRIAMDAPEVESVADRPEWIADGLGRPLSLHQVYLLNRFKHLQHGAASANEWLACFAAAQAGGEDPAEHHARLSGLLGWPAADIALLAVGAEIGIEDGRIATVQQADYVARRIALCQDLAVGAAELLALEAAGDGAHGWAAARAAALSGLERFEGGAHAAAARGAVDEESRDALAALYMARVAGGDETLRDRIVSLEHLYEYLLLDVNVSREVPTTRMLEATGTVQLYVNQMLENAEAAVFEDREAFVAEWETGQEYRRWEANEKLRLYPGNYIEPELRRGKTGVFRTFEQVLSEGDINADVTQRAVSGYVTDLQRLSELRAHGFFLTREADATVCYFVARALWERHGYYYRKLEIDALRLEDGSPHAFVWSDWTRANLPFASEHVSAVMPGHAWNRLLLFWFEVEAETRTHDDGRLSTHYHLRPKYSRQNLDGSFTDPWSPALGQNVELEITDEIPPDAAGDPDPGAYEPVLYLPHYDADEDRILFYFSPFPSHDDPDRVVLVWTLSGSTSRNDIRAETVRFERPEGLHDYDSVPRALNMIPSGRHVFTPASHVDRFEWDYGGARVDVGRFEARLESEGGEDGYFRFFWTGEDGYFRGVDSGEREIYLQWLEVIVHLIVDLDPPHNEIFVGVARAAEDLPADHDGAMALAPIEMRGRIPQDHWYGGEVQIWVRAMLRDSEIGGSESHSEYYFSSYRYGEADLTLLFHGKHERGREAERYLLNSDEDRGAHALCLFSAGIGTIAGQMYPGLDVRRLLALENQQPPEPGVDNFLDQAGREYGEIQLPRPRTELDFDGAYGLYAWELFFHVPLTIAARYNAAGRHEEARDWLHTIYNPRAEPGGEWGVWPLLPEREAGSAPSIADPDRIAVEQPAHYRLATLRHYLRTMTDQGDALYRQETPETLRRAKMWYASAKTLFLEVAGDAFARSTRSDWADPTLGAATQDDFRPPYNEEVRAVFETLERRLDDLRHWRSIDGEPLTIPLVAAPLDPRELQRAALSGVGSEAPGDAAQSALPYSFETALGKARGAVENLMYFGDLLTRGLYRRDELALEELLAAHARHVAENLEVGGQKSLIESMGLEKAALEKEKEEAEEYLRGYSRFADELMNASEEAGHAMFGIKGTLHGTAMAARGVSGGLALIPTIFGLAAGGAAPDGVSSALAAASEQNAEWIGTMGEALLHRGEVWRRRQENEMERDATARVVERIEKEIERLEYDIGEEEGTLAELQEKSANAQALIDFHRRRATNREFRDWYLGRITSLYDAAYDITVRFCRLAERAWQAETGAHNETFIRPVWDSNFHGLLAGQSLMLDLQRMDFAFMERYQPPARGRRSIALSELNPQALRVLKRTGRALFTMDEARFDDGFPDEYERRIRSMRVQLAGIENGRDVAARLALVGHRVHFDRRRSPESAALNVFGRQQISLLDTETDTRDLTDGGGRFGPFERCGVHSTWMLSFPGAIEAIGARQRNSGHRALLRALDDVLFHIDYTARI